MAKQSDKWVELAGSAQQERLLSSLLPGSIPIDERQLSDLLVFVAAYSSNVNFYNDQNEPAGDWSQFFSRDISVFLAGIIRTDLESIDFQFEEALHSTRLVNDPDERRNRLSVLFGIVQRIPEMLNGWYLRAQTLRRFDEETRLEKEIEQGIQTDLCWQLQILTVLSGAALPGNAKKDSASKYHRIWRLEKQEEIAGIETPDPSDLNALLGKIQEVHRKFYLFALYLRELTPALLEKSLEEKSDHQPHIGLLIAFLKIFRFAQDNLNTLTRRHLEYYFFDVLKQQKRAGVPDRSFVCFTLADFASPYLLPKNTLLLAGINQEGLESHYRTLLPLEINKARVAALKTLFVSKNPLISTGSSYKLVSNIYAAPVAASMNGLGLPFENPEKSWPVLGAEQIDKPADERRMVAGTLGFALASSVLLLSEGERTIKVTLAFNPGAFHQFESLIEDISHNEGIDKESVFHRIFNSSLELSVTGAEGWIPVRRYGVNPLWADQRIVITFGLTMADPAIAGYDPGVIPEQYDTEWPLLRILLAANEAVYIYSFLKVLRLETIDLDVEVRGMKSLQLYNELGLLDGSAPFQPFGPTPNRNAYLLVGNRELFIKKLTDLKINIHWNNLPYDKNGFEDYYAAYEQDIDNDSFRVKLTALSDFDFFPKGAEKQEEFHLFESAAGEDKTLLPDTGWQINDLKTLQIRPDFRMRQLPEYTNSAKTGYFKFQISNPPMAFGQAVYPRLFARIVSENARPRPFSIVPGVEEPKPLPNEPFVPVVRRLTLNYAAGARLNMRVQEFRENDPAARDLLVHITPFGKRTVFSNGKADDHYLVPQYDADGYLFIGLEGLNPPEELSLLFHLTESVGKPSQMPIELEWQYLSHENWVTFPPDRVLMDSSDGLTRAGIVLLDIPPDCTPSEEMLTPGLFWLRVTGKGNLNALGGAHTIHPHAVEVEWVDNGDKTHYDQNGNLPKIKDLVQPIPQIAQIYQPVGFKGGIPPEDSRMFYTRVSERLRHKNRAVTIWDYERLVLEKFPEIRQVKCLGSVGNEQFLEPGEVMVVVIPEFEGKTVTPMAGFYDLKAIKSYLEQQGNAFARIRVVNPSYERLKVSCSLMLKAEFESKKGVILKQLHRDIRDYICPWVKGQSLELGRELSKNDLFAFIRDQPYVRYITGFSIVQVFETAPDYYELRDTAGRESDAETLRPGNPWSVFVPVGEHLIHFVDKEAFGAPEQAAIDIMRIGSDFVVLPDENQPEISARPPVRETEEHPDDEYFLFE